MGFALWAVGEISGVPLSFPLLLGVSFVRCLTGSPHPFTLLPPQRKKKKRKRKTPIHPKLTPPWGLASTVTTPTPPVHPHPTFYLLSCYTHTPHIDHRDLSPGTRSGGAEAFEFLLLQRREWHYNYNYSLLICIIFCLFSLSFFIFVQVLTLFTWTVLFFFFLYFVFLLFYPACSIVFWSETFCKFAWLVLSTGINAYFASVLKWRKISDTGENGAWEKGRGGHSLWKFKRFCRSIKNKLV